MTKMTQRLQKDIIGYAVTATQMEKVISESIKSAEQTSDFASKPSNCHKVTPFTAAICPHDDYIYAGRLVHLILSRIQAPRVVLFGVSHHAKRFNISNTLVFENFDQWVSPMGPIAMPELREELIHKLDYGTYIIHNEMHAMEHSLEGIAFYLNALNPDVEILPLLIPHMDWTHLKDLSYSFSGALADLIEKKNWILGEDIAFVCSNDGVHYGDVLWSGQGYAPFGTDLAGYAAAVDQDRAIMAETLQGELSAEKLKEFYHRCTDPADYYKYRVTWCGRFAVTFGLLAALRIKAALSARPLRHVLDAYGTSVSEAHLILGPDGPSATAPAHFHHFVGYPALGYT